MAVTHKLIETVTVTAGGGAASIAFSSIPQTFTDLKLVMSLRASDAATQILLSLNGSTSNFSARYLFGDGSIPSSGTLARYVGALTPSSFTASTFGNTELYIPNYAGSTNKSYSDDGAVENNATTGYLSFVAGLWSDTSAITSLTLTGNTGNFVQHSSASLYGIKNS
jgi:hypothetical protein